MAGYSGTPLAKKLGLRPGMAMAVLNPPWPYAQTLGLAIRPQEPEPDAALPHGLDFLHLFTTSCAELDRRLSEARRTIAPDGMIWVSWPKKASKRPSEITEDTVREVALPLGLVDVKVCAVDEVWSGLKLVIRRGLR
ncbi:DUF3052 domain-containing protein [Defluviimonas sp. WL0024]|uniref:DUF3052 domain-containing protein n=1 Tax=Albidovulum salinarum TaxID=2984153 RepID=A0ABT2X2H1_9RHOB|nr:DUF3052 domain-containing protein [Defluviimonas sp. WL0024]MCU9847494.1 DUF3052 domain-containing protein [Defluviimonas sp. WL0024]